MTLDETQPEGVGAENLIRPCEQDEWIEAMEWVNSILAMSGDVVAADTRSHSWSYQMSNGVRRWETTGLDTHRPSPEGRMTFSAPTC